MPTTLPKALGSMLMAHGTSSQVADEEADREMAEYVAAGLVSRKFAPSTRRAREVHWEAFLGTPRSSMLRSPFVQRVCHVLSRRPRSGDSLWMRKGRQIWHVRRLRPVQSAVVHAGGMSIEAVAKALRKAVADRIAKADPDPPHGWKVFAHADEEDHGRVLMLM